MSRLNRRCCWCRRILKVKRLEISIKFSQILTVFLLIFVVSFLHSVLFVLTFLYLYACPPFLLFPKLSYSKCFHCLGLVPLGPTALGWLSWLFLLHVVLGITHLGRVLLEPTGLGWLTWLGFSCVLLGINYFWLV